MTVTPPPSVGTAIIALFSMYSCSWWPTRYSPSRIRSAAANAASGSPRSMAYVAKTWSEASGSNTAGSGVVRGTARRARLAQRGPVGGGDERERLGVMLDLAADRHEDRLVRLDRADDVLARDVVGGHDDDLRPVERRVELERLERGVRDGRTDRGPVPGTRHDDVVGVQGRAGQLGGSLAAQRAGRTRSTGDGRRRRDDERVRGRRPGRHAQRRYGTGADLTRPHGSVRCVTAFPPRACSIHISAGSARVSSRRRHGPIRTRRTCHAARRRHLSPMHMPRARSRCPRCADAIT